MRGTAKGLGVVGAIALGCIVPQGARGAEEGRAKSAEARICPATAEERVVVCFGEDGLAPEQQGDVEEDVRELVDGLASEDLRLSGRQQLLVRIDGVQPNLVVHVEPLGEDGVTLAGWARTFSKCARSTGCTTNDWRDVLHEAMRQALVDLRPADGEVADPGHGSGESRPSTEPPRYRPERLGIAGIVAASVGGLGVLTGTGFIIVGAAPGNPAPGVRQDRDFLPLSRDFYTPGGVTLGVSAAVAAAGIAMVVVDFRRWKDRQKPKSTSGQRTRPWLTASVWGRGVKLEGRF